MRIFPTNKQLKRNGMGQAGAISRRLSRELARLDVERARWNHDPRAQVRTLADMSPDEIAALEARYGAKVAR